MLFVACIQAFKNKLKLKTPVLSKQQLKLCARHKKHPSLLQDVLYQAFTRVNNDSIDTITVIISLTNLQEYFIPLL